MRMKKATAFGLAALMAATMIPAVPAMAKGDDSEGSVYYLNFKPEQADQWTDLAKKYTDETGVPVTVVTAASGTYESTLKSEMAKDEFLLWISADLRLTTALMKNSIMH